ncbi:YkyA family protein [Bacillus sp. RG28]|uniref:YkyA family protein n=1 Tax=Gottfriedia endophytica TaxID=2820819 RepID=A0A940NII8_9BACI|nr:YkyA family protein [Gottfriedia endophytica]MBP0724722.1 YkyA family protein [Gottfriedia endophytica]
MRKFFTIVLGIIILGSLCSCNNQKENITLINHYEKVANSEKNFTKSVETIQNLTNENDKLLAQILKEGQKSNQNLLPILNKTRKNVSMIQEQLKEEKNLLQKSVTLHNEYKKYANKLDSKELQTDAFNINELYEKRYEAFINYYNQFLDITKQENDFINSLSTSKTNIDLLSKQSLNLNYEYEKLDNLINTFNQLSGNYTNNEMKFIHKLSSNE